MYYFNFMVYMSVSIVLIVECESKSGFKGWLYSLGYLIFKCCKCFFCVKVFLRLIVVCLLKFFFV